MTERPGLKRRDLLKMGAALAGGSLLAACGGGTAAPSASAAAAGSAAASAGASAAAGGAESIASLEAAAKAEGGQILWYNAGNPQLVKSVTDGFQKAYPWAKLQGVSLVFSDMPTKIVTETVTGAPTADVIWSPPTLRQTWLKNNVVVKVKLVNDSLMPATTLDTDEYAHPVWQLLIVPQYNTKLGVNVPSDPYTFADPSWKGKLAFDRVQNLGQSTTWLSVWKTKWGDSKWQTWLDGLAKNGVLLTPNAGAAHDAVQSGEREVAIASSNYVLAQVKGAPVAMSFAIEPVPFFNHSYLTRRAKSPKSAQLFMNWSSSKDGQTAIAAVGLSPIMSSIDAPSSLSKMLPSGVEPATAADLADFSNNTDQYQKILSAKFPG